MRLLSRSEELILLTIWKLQPEAYGMSIKANISEITGRKWSFSAVYTPISRLLDNKMIISREGDSTPRRGGRSKVFYSITPAGKRELVKIQRMYDFLWNGAPSIVS